MYGNKYEKIGSDYQEKLFQACHHVSNKQLEEYFDLRWSFGGIVIKSFCFNIQIIFYIVHIYKRVYNVCIILIYKQVINMKLE